ncbi:MAG: hypothetical protein NT066_00560 [Candidatus Omnitrophica bacterium]|nr:hypothetical protein [Candidatus Omnitrophota bacterium]
MISLLGHITVFSIFSFSFGRVIPKSNYPGVSFWGQVLHNFQVQQPLVPLREGLTENRIKQIRKFFLKQPDTSALDNIVKEQPLSARYYLKPPLNLSLNTEKEIFIPKPEASIFSFKRKEPTIIFHPLLPYSFTLYFKDRQVAHVELMFKIASSGLRDSIAIKRKISSGNLEVDLLTMRYIGHYLFIQKAGFAPNIYQAVKIDLSAGND